MLPYGEWVVADGRAVLFNRRYEALVQRRPDGAVERADPDERFEIIEKRWFYNDGTPESLRRKAGEEALVAWGLPVPTFQDYKARLRALKENL
jgi:hypothetical protein